MKWKRLFMFRHTQEEVTLMLSEYTKMARLLEKATTENPISQKEKSIMTQTLKFTLFALVLGMSMLLTFGCSDDPVMVDPDVDPVPNSRAPIDSLILGLPDIVTSTSGVVSTNSGTTSNWAGKTGAPKQDRVTDEGQDTSIVGGKIWVCQEHERTYSDVNDQFPLFGENADVIWPGATLQGQSLYRATPDPITAPRGPGDLVWSQINGSTLSSVHVETTSLASIKRAADSLLSAQPTQVPADLQLSITRVSTKEDLQIAVDASADLFGIFGGSASFNLDEDVRYNYFMVTLRQNMFTLVYQRPEQPHEYFAPGVDLTQIAPFVGPNNPPAYVSSVTYGRVFYALIRSSESEQDMAATLDANFTLGVVGASVGSSVNYLTDFRDYKAQWFVYGGSTSEIGDAIGGGLGTLKAFKAALQSGSNFRLAKPVFATIRSVASDELVRNGYTLGYTYRQCQARGEICTPAPLSPQPDAILDNGCNFTNNSTSWTFSWTACPGATGYQIMVNQASLGTVIDAPNVTGTSYTRSFSTPFTVLSGWTWRVRSYLSTGWGPWSSQMSFTLEPVGTDCNPRLELFQHPNYLGDRRTFTSDTPDLDLGTINFADVASSLKIYDLNQVRLYDGRNYTGEYITVTGNIADLRSVSPNFNDRIGSIDFPPFR